MQYNLHIYPEFSDTLNPYNTFEKIHLTTSWYVWKYAGWVANNVDPDQMPLCDIWSGSTLFALACLSKHVRLFW